MRTNASPPRGTVTLVERAEELAALDEVLAATQGGGGRVVVIEGPAGIGKTSLLAEARARAAASGARVLHARGSELESAFSFGVVRQLFEPVFAPAWPDPEATLAGAAAHAGRLFGAGAAGGPASEDDVFSLLHGLYWLTLNLAESQPLVLAIDDLQWVDAPTLRWLSYLARRIEGQAVCVIATMRPLEEEDPLLAELLVDPATAIVRPKALSASSVAELVRADFGVEADDEFCLACHRATGGNPLLLRELLRSLAAEEVAPVAASAGIVERLAPDAVGRSVTLRLSRLAPEAGRLARAVAILGDGASHEHAGALAELERRQVASTAATLGRVGLLRQESPLAFVHPIVGNAVYAGFRAEEREAGHARAAEILKAANAPPAHVAAHVLLAPPGSVEAAVEILRQAARQATSEGGLESASSYLRRGLDEPLTDRERAELLLELASVELELGSTSVVVDHLQQAVGLLDDPACLAEARLQLGQAFYWAGREEDGVRVLEDALAEWTRPDDLRRRLQATLVMNASRLAPKLQEARRLLESLEVSADEGPGARLLLALQAFHEASGGGSRERALARARQAIAAMSDQERRWSFVGPFYTLLVGDELDEPLRALDALIADARKDGAAFRFAGLSIMRAVFHFVRGALIEAEADARTAFDAMPHRHVAWAPFAYGGLAQILVERGAIDEAAAITDEGERSIAGSTDTLARVPVLRARATVAAARGEHRTALATALALGVTLASLGSTNPATWYPSWRSLAAQAQLALGRTEEGLRLAREDVALARAWGAPRTLGRALRVLGLVEGGEEGLERLRRAVRVLADSPARLEHGYALADLGAALRRANRRAEARESLRGALELAHQNGATLLAERAHAELVIAGGRPRRVVLTGIDALTPSERRVAAMAADGLSNREIAQALFVTLRTVEMHLTNAFRKLDISTRTQLPNALKGSREVPVGARAG